MKPVLEGLMQNDFPLTLNHIRRRMASCNLGAEVVTLLEDGSVQRIGHAAVAERIDRLARVLAGLGVRAGRPRGHLRMEQPAPLRAVLRGAVHGRGAAHAQHPPVRGAADLHRQPRRGQGHLRRRVARSRAGQTRADVRQRGALRGDGRRRGVLRDRAAAECRALRGPDGAGRGRSRPSVRVPRAGRAPGGRALLHERHHRQPQGRAVLAPLDQPALLRDADDGRQRPLARRPRARGGPDVPRQRVGAPLRRGAGWSGPDPARPLPRARSRWRS